MKSKKIDEYMDTLFDKYHSYKVLFFLIYYDTKCCYLLR